MTYLQPDNRVRSATAVAQTDALVIKVPNPHCAGVCRPAVAV